MEGIFGISGQDNGNDDDNDDVFYVYFQYRYPLSALLMILLKHPFQIHLELTWNFRKKGVLIGFSLLYLFYIFLQ